MAGTHVTQYLNCPFIITPALELKISNKQLWVNLGFVRSVSISEQFKNKGATFKVIKLTCVHRDAPVESETYVLDISNADMDDKCHPEWNKMLRSYKILRLSLKSLASMCVLFVFEAMLLCCFVGAFRHFLKTHEDMAPAPETDAFEQNDSDAESSNSENDRRSQAPQRKQPSSDLAVAAKTRVGAAKKRRRIGQIPAAKRSTQSVPGAHVEEKRFEPENQKEQSTRGSTTSGSRGPPSSSQASLVVDSEPVETFDM